MKTVKEIAKFIKEKVEFLKENPEFGGSYMSLEGPYEGAWAVVVRWSAGWGFEDRDDAIQSPLDKDYALEACIAKIASNDMIEDWDMFSDAEGNIVDGTGIEPTDKAKDGYKHVAEFLLEQYEQIQEAENSVNESKTLEEFEEKEWGIIFNVADIEDDVVNSAFYTSGIGNEENHITISLIATTEEEAEEEFKDYLLDTYGIPKRNVEITNIALQESLKEESQNWGVMQDVEQKVYKNNPSLKLGFVVTGLTKEEAEKQAKEKNTEKLNAKGIFYRAAEVKEGDKKLKEFMDRSLPLKKVIKEEEHREEDDFGLPGEITIELTDLISAEEIAEEEYVEDLAIGDIISDYLSDEYGFVHFGFDYDIQGDNVLVTNIKWDTSESIRDIKRQSSLTEGAPNFGRSDIINLCSNYYRVDDFDDYANDLREEDPEISDDEIRERAYELITDYYNDEADQIKQRLKDNDVEDICYIEQGYHEGFQIEFKFDNAQELIWEISYYKDHVDDVKDTLNKKIDGMIKALTESVEEGQLNEFSVAYQFSNGEAGYTLEKDYEKVVTEIKEVFEKLRTEALAVIDADPDFERDGEDSSSEEEFTDVDDNYGA